MLLSRNELAAMIDHTLLKAFAVDADIEALCREAAENNIGAVCVNPAQVRLAKACLADTGVRVCSVVSFPLGQNTIEEKVREAESAIAGGAVEIDYVLHIGRLRMGDGDYIRREMEAMTALCREKGAAVKVIFENCYLTKEQIQLAARVAREVRPDFIKTSTGFGTGGAAVEDVRLMKEAVGPDVKVKAAGGIRTWDTAQKMLEAGAERLGTSSGPQILREFDESQPT